MKILSSIFTLIILTASTVTFAGQAEVDAITAAYKAKCPTKWGPNEEKVKENYSLYREYVKQKQYKSAYPFWIKVVNEAPGARQTPWVDGAKIYGDFIKKAKDPAKKEAYIDTLLAIYDIRSECFGKTGGIMVRKAFAYYQYRGKDKEKVLALFDEAAKLAGPKASAGMLKPYISTAVKLQKAGKVQEAKVFEVYDKCSEIAEANYGNEKVEGKYKLALDGVDEMMSKEGYFTCERIVPMMQEKYTANPEDKATLIKAYNALRSAKCTDTDLFLDVARGLNKQEPSAGRSMFIGLQLRKDKKYDQAIEFIEQAITLEEDAKTKAEYTYVVAEILQSKGDFSGARAKAMEAAGMREGWGQPYMLIGRLYASSGKKCGPGTGWDSQVVSWVAIDMFQKAKAMDPEVAEEAQKLINKYSAYLPTAQEGFMKSVKNGDSYTVGCWINRTTTARLK